MMDYNADAAAMKQTKQTTEDNTYNDAAMQTTGDKADDNNNAYNNTAMQKTGNEADNNDAVTDVNAATQTMDNNLEDAAVKHTMGNNARQNRLSPAHTSNADNDGADNNKDGVFHRRQRHHRQQHRQQRR